ncbi:MAG: hypothetical protein JRH20_13585 [Deltaproteobacteria bacterium]|nr:hypothetical protein [Deltaproteobacteria bacterium]
MRPILTLLIAASFVAACADTTTLVPDSAPDGVSSDAEGDYGFADTGPVDQFVLPDGFILGKTVVYAHTPEELFKVDPETMAVTSVAAFVFPTEEESKRITDIALDKDGKMVGVTRNTVYAIDVATAVCTRLASNAVHYVGLSYVVDTSKPDKTEFLMGLDKDGTVYEINPETGATTPRGGLGKDPVDTAVDLNAAGDIVSVRGLISPHIPGSTTLATVVRPGYDNDWLAWINTTSVGNFGEAALIGDTGFARIWGLGFWQHDGSNKIFGFTTEGEFLLINILTGKATLHSQDIDHEWWGAGVTTDAPTID